jgi:hypothetical protein
MRGGDFFVTSGEVLFRGWSVEGTGAKRTYTAEVEWTFPLEFAELVWGDGMTTHRKVVPMSALGPFGTQRFQVPFDARIKWVRFAVWDSAGWCFYPAYSPELTTAHSFTLVWLWPEVVGFAELSGTGQVFARSN